MYDRATWRRMSSGRRRTESLLITVIMILNTDVGVPKYLSLKFETVICMTVTLFLFLQAEYVCQ